MPLMSIREYARHRGCTHDSVRKALRAGRITAEGRQGIKVLIDSERADAQWRASTDPSNRGRPQAAARSVENPAGRAYAGARAIREQYEARLARLQFEERSGALVNADEVKVAAFNAARGARDALQGIPDRIAPILTAQQDTRRVHAILTEEILRVCNMLSGEAPLPDAERG